MIKYVWKTIKMTTSKNWINPPSIRREGLYGHSVGSRKKINSVKHLFEELVALRLMSTLGDFKHLGDKGGGLEPPKPPPLPAPLFDFVFKQDQLI